MCLRPILIDNPYRGLKHIGRNRFHDCTSLKISVPCGNCSSCISLRQNYFVQRCQMENLDNFLFMFTLTYNRKSLPVLKVNGYTYSYALWSDVQNMFKRLRKSGKIRPFRYFIVSERGSEKHRIHYHGILSVPRYDGEDIYTALELERQYFNLFLSEWRRKIGGSLRSPIYQNLCDYIKLPNGRSTYDFHYIDPRNSSNGESDVGFYVTKYVTKSDEWFEKVKSALKFNLSPDDYEEVYSKLRLKVCNSHNWGNPHSENVKLHIRKGIDSSKRNKDALFPYFINPFNGSTFPLSPYYQKIFMTTDDQECFYLKRPDVYLDNIIDNTDFVYQKFKDDKFKSVQSLINSRLNSCDVYDFIQDENVFSEVSENYNFTDTCSDLLPDDWQNDFFSTE